MAQVIREISVDVAKANVFQAIVAKQNDDNSRFLKVTLTNEGAKLEIVKTSTVTINALREDGAAKAFLGTVNEDGTVTVPLVNWILELDGNVKCDITVVDAESRKLTSTMFTLAVEEAAYLGDDVSQDENYDLLIQLLDSFTATKAEAIQATDDANAAANLANEKATLAGEKAALADEKATLADTNATAAKNAADRANEEADNLETVLTEAMTALDEMATATEEAEQATQNANTATTNADNATASASQATREALSAKDSANTAAENANIKATLADEKATLADEKATLAQEATEAANKATADAVTAKTNADTATENANTAAGNAQAAADRVGDLLQAENVSYDNSDSGLDADNVKSAIDELTQKMGGVAKIVVESWEDVQKIVRLGLAPKTFAIGDQLICNHATYGELVWDIIGFDHDVPTDDTQTHSMTIQLHSLLSDSLMFDAIEALYYAETELPAGTYNFTLVSGYDTTYGGGKTYYFTIANPVPAGGQIVFNWGYQKQAAECKISTYASQTSTTVIESVGVTEGSEGTALENTNHTHRARYGSNRWSQSAIRQWLNSDGEKSAWWNPSNIYDRPVNYISTKNGFLNGLDADFLAVIGEVTKRNALNTVTDGGGYEDTTELMFLISRGEVYGGNENGINEGTPYPYYSENSDLSSAGTGTDANRIKSKVGGAATYWWLRSCYSGVGSSVRLVTPAGSIGYASAYYPTGVAPACNII